VARTTFSVIDPVTYREKTRIIVPNGPGMTIFSPDGYYGYVLLFLHAPDRGDQRSADHHIVGRVPQASPFCPNTLRRTPVGKQVWSH